METVWDWVTIICFGGLVVLMLQRSVEERTRDHLMEYLFPALGCAVVGSDTESSWISRPASIRTSPPALNIP